MSETKHYLSVTLLEETDYSLLELCDICGIERDVVMEMVAEGILEPKGGEPAQWRFEGTTLVRIRTVLHLQNDLHVNLPGAALALELMDELQELRRIQRLLIEQMNP
ncbi:MAG: chaperone modulator CbpM [Candidatus Thiodiazotropha sp.]|jgi:chaperone modulatory protein CbpM